MNGTIKTLTERGFGFITAEGMEKDLFFHSNSLVGVQFDELREGDAVTFETAESDKGPNAVNVQRASETVESDKGPNAGNVQRAA
ncbi:MAG: cold shock domain-containing protein [Candidatus Spechtbacterales bacterium]